MRPVLLHHSAGGAELTPLVSRRKSPVITAGELERDRGMRAARDRREERAAEAFFARQQHLDSVQLDDEPRDGPAEKWHEKRWKPSLPIVTLTQEEIDKLPTYRGRR